MDIIFLRVIIFIIFCLIGLGIGGLVGNKVSNHKKINGVNEELIKYSSKLLKESEECQEGICPESDNQDGNKNLEERR